MGHKEKIIHLSFAVLTSSKDKRIFTWQLPTLPLHYQHFQTHMETFFPYRSYGKNTALYCKHVQELLCTKAGHVPFFK